MFFFCPIEGHILSRDNTFMTQLAADFAAKGLLNLMTISPEATGLAH